MGGGWVFFFFVVEKIKIFTLSVKTTLVRNILKIEFIEINMVARIQAEKTPQRCRRAFLRMKRTTYVGDHLLISKVFLDFYRLYFIY